MFIRALDIELWVEDAIRNEEGARFDFDGGFLKIRDPVESDGTVSVRFAITVDPDLEGRMERILNKVNFGLDGEESPFNPRIDFDDNSPRSPTITDNFEIFYAHGVRGSADLYDI